MSQSDPSTKKSGLWGFVKGAFVEEVPEGQQASQPPPRGQSSPPPVAHAAPVAHPPPTFDQASREKLEAAVVESAPQGYLDFEDFLSTLADSIPDEDSRWRAALKLVSKRGHSPEALLGDFDKCIGILQEKYRQFDAETQEHIKKKVSGRKEKVGSIDSAILLKQEEIAKIQSQIAGLAEERKAEVEAMDASHAKILAVKAGFDSAFRSVHDRIAFRRSKLEQFRQSEKKA
jgi:hypothetical protein